MYWVVRSALVLGSIIIVGGFAEDGKAAGKQKDLQERASHAERLDLGEIYKLYANKTWKWGKGGAFFAVKQRRFVAVSYEKGVASVADGKWFIPREGKVCFRANWAGSNYAPVKKLSCYEHSKDGKVLYQRKSEKGKEWSVFRHSPPKRWDGFNYLKPGDRITRQYDRVARRVLPE